MRIRRDAHGLPVLVVVEANEQANELTATFQWALLPVFSEMLAFAYIGASIVMSSRMMHRQGAMPPAA